MTSEITREQIDELVRFLPVFENPGPELKATWSSMEPDPVTGARSWPHPDYPPVVNEFFRLAAQPCWRYQGNHFDDTAEILHDPEAIAGASMDEIKAMLTAGAQLERIIDGLQDSMVQSGQVAAILRRLVVLRGEEQLGR